MDRIRTIYEERRRRFANRAGDLERRSRRIANVRLAAFLLTAAGFFAPVFGAPSRFLWPATAVFFAVFVTLIFLHVRVEREKQRAEEGRRINEEAIRRLCRDWAGVPEPRLDLEPSLARDLDVFGHASLWKLLGTASTPSGKATLARWLLEPAEPEEIRERQEAVRELAPRLDFRQQLQLRTRTMEKLDPGCEPFLRWAEGEPWLAGQPALEWCARTLPLALWTLVGLNLGGILTYHWWVLLGLFNLSLAARFLKRIHAVFTPISSREGEFRGYSRALELLIEEAAREDSAPRLRRLVESLTHSASAPRQMERLHRLVALSDVRFSGSLHAPLQAAFFWDVHVLASLEKWQQEVGAEARRWLATLGEMEALSALAGLSFDEPDWAFPEVSASGAEDGPRFAAEALGHPLLAADVRVDNDVEVGPRGTFPQDPSPPVPLSQAGVKLP